VTSMSIVLGALILVMYKRLRFMGTVQQEATLHTLAFQTLSHI